MPLNLIIQITQKGCPDSIGMGVRNESEWVSGMDWNHCPEWIGMGVRNASEYAPAGIRRVALGHYLVLCFFRKEFTNILLRAEAQKWASVSGFFRVSAFPHDGIMIFDHFSAELMAMIYGRVLSFQIQDATSGLKWTHLSPESEPI